MRLRGRGDLLMRLATQVQARNQQRAAGEGQGGLLLVITHGGESSSTMRRDARSCPTRCATLLSGPEHHHVSPC